MDILNFFLLIKNILPVLFVVLIFAGFLVLFYLLFFRKKQKDILDKLDYLHAQLKEDIKYAVAPKFIELSLNINNLVELAIEVWRIEQRVIKTSSNLSDNQKKSFENSIQKLKRYLEKYDIEIIDYTNRKYNEGLNLDVLSVEKDESISESIVKETIEPTIMCKGQVVRKAKIILLSK